MPHASRAVADQAALAVAQQFIRSAEAKDLDAVSRTLAPGARQLFMHTRRARTPEGVVAVIDGRTRGFCVADIKGRQEVLAYTNGIFQRFVPLVWRNHEWTVSPGGREVFFHGVGDMVVARTGRAYRNTYTMRFDIEGGRITSIAAYGDALMFAGLLVRPSGGEVRALLRAVKRMVSPGQSSRSGR